MESVGIEKKVFGIYNLDLKEVLEKFSSSGNGLSETEAQKRLKESGKNIIERKSGWKWPKMIFNQFNDVLVWILLVAGGLAFLFKEYRDVTIILAIVGINAVIGFLQEFRAERVLESMRKLAPDNSFVIRDGKKKEIDSKLLVVGDVVSVSAGDSVPADGYLLESFNIKASSFVFTGESIPETKEAKVLVGEVDFADVDNMVFMGETVAMGEGKFLVTETGSRTKLGKIADLAQNVQDESTPMQKQMKKLGREISVLSIFIGILVMIGGQYFKVSLYENFLFALALAVSVVPEGLPAAISVSLSLGMKRLLKYNVLAKKLNAVETLGSVSMICTDKTGTITKNELMVVKAVVDNIFVEVSGSGYEPKGKFLVNGKEADPEKISNLEMLLKIGTLCNEASLAEKNGAYVIIGDPTEGALIVAGKKFSQEENYFKKGEKKITENPFSSERMMMSVVYENIHQEKISYVKGSPDVVLNLCAKYRIGEKELDFSQEEKMKVKKMYDAMSSEALRVLAFASKKIEGGDEKYESGLVWIGMMAMIDPPRMGVSEAVAQCKELGVKVIMITGDYEITARAIADKIGLTEKQDKNSNLSISGKTLSEMKDEEIYAKIKNGACVFARISPEQKLRIASILKDNGQIIAMTGDGVNDAPALRKADIGVAMGLMGTDVSKQASDMILLDDNFSSIVNGVKEGRLIFSNLRKFAHYVLTSNASELFTVLFGVLLQIPAPITAVQILSIDLATDVFPSFSLGLEPPEPGAASKENNSQKSIMTKDGFRRIIYLGILMATGGAVAFIWSMLRGGWNFGESIVFDSALYMKSTTATYAVLAMTQMANLVQSRSEKYSPFQLGFFKNKYLIGSIFLSFLILLAFMYAPFFQKNLRMLPIDWQDWLMVVVSMIMVYLLEERRKENLD
ncbi:MAG: hypothetical protein ACD_11C00105G0013 [uncultured bacterium]|nr:MAG: hypothetical protein ACD_11C00105G0013 [uncultured bacterium]HBR71364.1 hypothetical protein [Candidatus Moranbacteria bacterium]